MADLSTFNTHDVDLAAYLMQEGLKYIEAVPEPNPRNPDSPRIIFRFFDEKQIARDLERTFMSSEIKKYQDCRKYLLKEVHRAQGKYNHV